MTAHPSPDSGGGQWRGLFRRLEDWGHHVDLGNGAVITKRRSSRSGSMEIPRAQSRVLLTNTHGAHLRDSQDTSRSHLRGTRFEEMSPMMAKVRKMYRPVDKSRPLTQVHSL